jgi:non-ribosomal peptide synthase protein (TIGR01720 family)
LRYLTGASGLADQPAAQVSFNYLGQFDDSAAEQTPDTTRETASRLVHRLGAIDGAADPADTRTHLLEVVARVENGSLEFLWAYTEAVHDEATVVRLAEQLTQVLRDVIAHCAQPGVGGRTPSDFPLAGLDQAGVDRLVGGGVEVEDVYPLSPMQAGMVFHGLAQGDQGVYVEQATFVLDGVGDPNVLGAAWQMVVDRTPVLRTRIVWEAVPQPLQVVQHRATVPITYLDWTHFSESDRQAELAGLLDADRAEGLDLTAGVCSRCCPTCLPAMPPDATHRPATGKPTLPGRCRRGGRSVSICSGCRCRTSPQRRPSGGGLCRGWIP